MNSPDTASIEPPEKANKPAASARDRGADLLRRAESHRRLLVVGALLLLGVVLGWQGWLLRQNQTAARAVQDSVEAAVPQVRDSVVSELGKVTTALADATFLGQARVDSPQARAQAAARLQRLLPGAEDVVVYSTGPEALLQPAEGNLGYLRAAQLAQAQGTGVRQVSGTRESSNAARLSVVQPVMDGDRIVAFAALAMPFDSTEYLFRTGVGASGGRLQLRTGPGASSLVLASTGSAERSDVDVTRRVLGTDLWVTGTRASRDAWLPDSVPALSVWGVALVALLVALLLASGDRLQRATAWMPGRRKDDPHAAPTFAQVLEQDKTEEADADELAESSSAQGSASATAVEVDAGIFRAYDIRGVVGKTLDEDVARALGRAIGSEAVDRGQKEIVVGRDGRNSGPALSAALIEGICATGVDVIDIGMAPTPVVYFACFHLHTGSGIAVTGSHNPPDYNGFKIVLGGETLAMDAIQALHRRIVEGRLHQGEGHKRSRDVAADYIERIASDVQVQRPLKVIVDCGNGVTGEIGPRVIEEIGCEVTSLYADIDGDFPNHHPDPSNPDNLTDLILAVKHHEADLGIAFDGDGDRLGVVTRVGEIIYPDRLLMLFAQDVLVRDPGATIIYDVKCTGRLQQLILRHGGSPLMWKTGHSLIKAKIAETGAALAGELSGHFFFSERWYGFDDGIYAAARLLEILAGDQQERSPEAVFATLPKGVSTPEINIATEEGENHDFVERFCLRATFEGARLTTIDGLRADWPDGWGLVRASNTTPALVLRFNADSQKALERIQQVFREQIKAVDPQLDLPF